MISKKQLICLAFFGLFGNASSYAQPDIFVDKNAGGANNGSSWINAYTELSTAISNASPLDEIWVADGVYLAGASAGDTFDLPVGIELYGGFQGASHPGGGETSRDERNPDPETNGTVLGGDINADDNPGSITGTNTSIILTIDTASPFPVVDGFEVSGATDTAVLIDGSSPTLRNLLITENHGSASLSGTAMRIATNIGTAAPVIANVRFTNNSSQQDGGRRQHH